MNRPSLRLKILTDSIERLLGPSETVHSVAVMFTRHRWFLPYSAFAAVAIFAVASATGIAGLGSRLLLAVCGMAIAGLATTNYWVLADLGNELVLCRSSRVRQYAKSVVTRLPRNTDLDMVGSTVITSDWKIRNVMYTVTKRWEAPLRLMAGPQRNPLD